MLYFTGQGRVNQKTSKSQNLPAEALNPELYLHMLKISPQVLIFLLILSSSSLKKRLVGKERNNGKGRPEGLWDHLLLWKCGDCPLSPIPLFFFPMSPASHPLFLVSRFLQMIQDPVSFLLSTEWFRITLENLLWHYFIFKSTTPLDPCHNENHPALNPPNTHPATNFRAKNTSSRHDSPLFSIRSPPNNPCLLSHFFLTFPIPDFGLFTALYKPPKI